jgi:hypothetical protein
MAAAAKDMDRLLDWQLVLQLQIREIEGRYPDLHEDLVDWGRWGRGIGTKPKLTRPGIWSLPGDYDPDLDPDAVPESPDAPINEKRVLELDARIGNQEFPAVWRRTLCINYIGARNRVGYYVLVPEWQRHKEAKQSPETYRLSLGESLRAISQGLYLIR